MAKAETFQDLSLKPPGEGQELGRWLYTGLRAAIVDGRLKPGPLAACQNSTLSHAEEKVAQAVSDYFSGTRHNRSSGSERGD